MLEEKHLAIASLFCAVLGTAMLFLLNQAIEPKEMNVRDIDEAAAGARVSVAGRIGGVLERENFILLTLNDGAKIKVIKFNPLQQERSIAKKDSFVVVVGKVQLYKNEVEIVAEEIRQW